ncbi:MAG: glycosyltransferase family 39 protein [Chloroflexi bacterium]|nr:glycosyltransferase family 39 protein [Chloroflexota bacterium]
MPSRFSALRSRVPARVVVAAGLAATLGACAYLRLWDIGAVGFNSDEAVYSGQAATLAGLPEYAENFSIFRAHPLLFQFFVSLVYRVTVSDVAARLVAAFFGLLTIAATYKAGEALFNKRVGALGALFIAFLPFHVILSREAILETPLTFFFTMAIFSYARYRSTGSASWAFAAGISAGLAIMSKEVGFLVLAVIAPIEAYDRRLTLKHLAVFGAALLLAVSPHLARLWITAPLEGGGGGGGLSEYLTWQISRPANHPASFYVREFPFYFGYPLLLLLGTGLIFAARKHAAPTLLLLLWFVVPFLFFQAWPTKGFHYLLPLAPAVCLLGALSLDRLWRARTTWARPAVAALVGITVLSLAYGAATNGAFGLTSSRVGVAGYAGLPGGREAARWIDANTPENSSFLTIGPSMINIVKFYSGRDASALSVSPNPERRNPAYEPVRNADYLLRWGLIDYVIFDVYSAGRTPHFANRMLDLIERYGAEAVHVEYAAGTSAAGDRGETPVITIYEVRIGGGAAKALSP